MSTVPTKDEASGAWSYPEGWTQTDREAWEGAVGEIAHHEKEAERILDAGAKMLNSPAVLIEQKRAEVVLAKAARERAERMARGEVAWVKARAAYGERVTRIDGEEGDVLIMGTPDTDTITRANKRSDEIIDAIRASLKRDASEKERLEAEARALRESIEAQTDALLEYTTVGGFSADESKARLRDLVKRYAGLRPMLFHTRDTLITGYRAAEGKGFAP